MVGSALGMWGIPHYALGQPDDPVVVTEPPEPEASVGEPAVESSSAPEPSAPTAKKQPPGHLRVGGGVGFGFASDFITIGIAPQVSYIFKRIVEPGVTFRYEYTKDSLPVPDVRWHTYGASLFVRLFPIQMLFFLVEGEILNAGFRQGGQRSDRMNYGNLLLGGGFMLGVGRGAFVATSIKFAVFRNAFYPDAFPIISVGAGYSF